jgi:hypothetical protein
LAHVSCPAASTTCVAVGDYVAGSNDKTLVERWNGTSWSVTASPNPSTSAQLAGVSCSTATACDAVGDYITSISDNALVEQYA